MALKNTAVTVLLTLFVYYFQASRSLSSTQRNANNNEVDFEDPTDDYQTELVDGDEEDDNILKKSSPDDDVTTSSSTIGRSRKDELYEQSKQKLNELLSDRTAKETIEYTAERLKEIFTNHVSSSSLINISNGIKDILTNDNSQKEILLNLRRLNKNLRKPDSAEGIRKHFAKLKDYLEDEQSVKQIADGFDALADVITSDGIEDALTTAGNGLITLVQGPDPARRIRMLFRDLDALMRSNPDEVAKNAAKNTLSSANKYAGRFARKLTGRGNSKLKKSH